MYLTEDCLFYLLSFCDIKTFTYLISSCHFLRKYNTISYYKNFILRDYEKEYNIYMSNLERLGIATMAFPIQISSYKYIEDPKKLAKILYFINRPNACIYKDQLGLYKDLNCRYIGTQDEYCKSHWNRFINKKIYTINL